MQRQVKHHVIIDCVCEKSLTELDFVLHDEIEFDYEKHELVEVELRKPQWEPDGDFISMQTLREIMRDFKECEATHVKLEAHPDHHGYQIAAYIVRPATSDDLPSESFTCEQSEMTQQESNDKRAELILHVQQFSWRIHGNKSDTLQGLYQAVHNTCDLINDLSDIALQHLNKNDLTPTQHNTVTAMWEVPDTGLISVEIGDTTWCHYSEFILHSEDNRGNLPFVSREAARIIDNMVSDLYEI
jgi:hypothetical protein